MTPERSFWLSQAGFTAGNLFIVLGNQWGDLAAWQLVFAAVLVLSTLWFVGYAVQERKKGVPEFFREWTGWQRLARVAAVAVFVLGTLTFGFGSGLF
ncbi:MULTISPECIES: hypothetical protein [Haloferax]|uniref:Uncharacterized protein n=2 Tax=Haloferax sulfurifontis TaxID=255616 RepID=M0IM90_9EURY|nr:MULTISPECIES: hypothetical protein [Haloferax]ELZ97926.1 hypothetical protein C441_03807 [Haloferax sulfurifontis ATCC BAA-897]MDS0240054.1 hypothetical protein [Haloferax sp. S2CR25]MDS0443175.1 hypothetical protein [Haloferax sp. S2CR25-2]GGC58154.1 hypothetical protein GCM10007209_20110 [Haloferax sulfurifontis]